MKSLKSHYGWHSVQAQADFLWFSGDGEEMRGAQSPRCRIQAMGPAGRESLLKRQPGSSEERARLFRSNEGELARKESHKLKSAASRGRQRLSIRPPLLKRSKSDHLFMQEVFPSLINRTGRWKLDRIVPGWIRGRTLESRSIWEKRRLSRALSGKTL